MGILQRIFGTENRAQGQVDFDSDLLQALIGTGSVSRETALQIPTVSGGINLIANIVSGTPIKLYRDNNGKAEEIRDDYRLPLLNDETGDTLNANEFWHAIILDCYLGKGGYAYICKSRGKIKSLHYVDEQRVSITKNADPIFKEFKLNVNGSSYNPWDFLRILRNTKDGASGTPITVENSRLISVSFQQLMLEYSMAKRGGNKKGFLLTNQRVDQPAMELLREAWRNLYSSDRENVMVLNNGLEFKECSDTSAEMQLDENKRTNATEFAKIFHVSPEAISGKSEDINSLAKLAAIPLMKSIECALNRDLLLEREKKEYYFAYDTKELLKGEMRERFEAYKTALDANFMQIDEVRYAEDLEPLGLTWIKLGLQDVLYDPKTKQIYTPNTDRTSAVGGAQPPEAAVPEEEPLPEEAPEIEPRADNNYVQLANGKMNGSKPSGKESHKSSDSGLTSDGGNGNMQSSQKPKWTKEEQKEPFDYWEMQDDKTGYPRHLKAMRFSGEETLQDHFDRHAKGLNCTTPETYVKNAVDFFESPRGENGAAYVRKDGTACRYDYGTKHLVIVSKKGIIETNWNLGDNMSPEDADDYWEKKVKK